MPNINRLRIIWRDSSTAETLGVHLDLEYGSQSQEAAQAVTLLDAVWDWWDVGVGAGPAAKTLWSAETILELSTIQRIDPTFGPVYTDDRTGIAGTRAGSAEMPQVAVVASFSTDTSARRQRGRIFLPRPVTTDTNGDGVLSDAYAGSVRTAVVQLATELESAGRLIVGTGSVNHVIWSTRSAGNPPAAFGVTRYRVGKRVDTQRRRLPKEQTYVT